MHICLLFQQNNLKQLKGKIWLIINHYWMKYSVLFPTKIQSLYIHLYNGSKRSCIFIRKHQYKNLLPFIFHQRLLWQELLWAFLTHFCGSLSLSCRRWFPLISYKTSVNKHNKRTNKNTHPMSQSEKLNIFAFLSLRFILQHISL